MSSSFFFVAATFPYDLQSQVFNALISGDQHANCYSAQENIGSVVCRSITSSSPDEILRLVQNITSEPQLHPMSVNAEKAKIISTLAFRGPATAASEIIATWIRHLCLNGPTFIRLFIDWLETAAALGGDFRMLETPVEREGVVRSYCLDILAGVFVLVRMMSECVDLTTFADIHNGSSNRKMSKENYHFREEEPVILNNLDNLDFELIYFE